MEKAKEFDVLKNLSSKAVLEFEELQAKYKQIYSKYSQEHDQNQKLLSQFKQLKRVSLLAVTEYENLMKRYTDEVKSKEECQRKLKKVEEENKELRKANKMAPNVAIIPASSNMSSSDGATKGELEGLRSLLTGMKEEMRRTKSSVTKLESQLEDEKREHDSTKQKLKIGNAQIQQLNRVSVMALDEFQDLRKKFELEVECRRKAEEYASQLLHNQQSEARTSRIVNSSSATNDQLENAFKEVEELNKILAKERSEHERNIKNLTEELDSQKDNKDIKALEEKMSVALDQIELLQTQLHESEDRAQQQERKARDLHEKLVRTEAALVSGVPVPAAPPPPPPPPPPPMPAPMIRKFITRIGVGKKKKDDKMPEKDDPVQDMMKEMMARIKKGALLKSQNQLQKDDKAPAMNELADLLTNLRRGQSSSKEHLDGAEKKEAVPEFQKFKLRKISTEPPKIAEKPKKDSELMKKLDKQRLAAENEETKTIEEDEEKSVNSNQESDKSNEKEIESSEASGKKRESTEGNGIKETASASLDASQSRQSNNQEAIAVDVGELQVKADANGKEERRISASETASTDQEGDIKSHKEDDINENSQTQQSDYENASAVQPSDSRPASVPSPASSESPTEQSDKKPVSDVASSEFNSESESLVVDSERSKLESVAAEQDDPNARSTNEGTKTDNAAPSGPKDELEKSFDAIFDEINEFL